MSEEKEEEEAKEKKCQKLFLLKMKISLKQQQQWKYNSLSIALMMGDPSFARTVYVLADSKPQQVELHWARWRTSKVSCWSSTEKQGCTL